MQRQGKIIAVFAIACVVLLAILTYRTGIFTTHRTESSTLSEEDAALRYPYAQLGAREQALYAALYTGISNTCTDIALPGCYTAEEYETVYLLLRMQEPQFFYVADVYQLSAQMTTVEMQYEISGAVQVRMAQELEAAADRILSSLSPTQSEGQQLLAIHDQIAARCVYESGQHASDAYGCLVEGIAQCEGYAKALCYVARRAGMDVMCVTGTSERGVRHVWNIANIDGAYYNIDLTWDDDDVYRGAVSHRYYAVPDARFGKHVQDGEGYQPPRCTADAENYFLKNGRILHEAAQMGVCCQMWAAGEATMLEFYCKSVETYQAVVADLRGGTQIQKAIAPYCRGGSYQYILDADGQTVAILLE